MRRQAAPTALLHYGMAVLLAAAAVALRVLLGPWLGHQAPFITLFPAVALSVWIGGAGPAVLTTLLGLVAVNLVNLGEAPAPVPPRFARFLVDGLFLVASGMIIAIGDVARRRTAEVRRGVLALRASEERARRQRAEIETIYDTAPIGMCILDRQMRFVRVNDRLAEMNGLPAAAHLGRTVGEVVPDLLATVEPVFRSVVETGRPVTNLEVAGETAASPGERRTWLEHWFPLRDERGDIIGVSVVAEEITARKRIEMELRESDRRKDEFLAILAHELRNPLAPIRSAVKYLQMRGPADADLRKARGIIERQTAHMARLVDDLLDLSRISRGLIRLERQPVNLADVIADAVEVSHALIEKAGHRLEVRLPPEPVQVLGDLVRLSQVLANLLNNAAKYTPSGGHIEVWLQTDGPDAVISVMDTGIGIPSEMHARVFDMFTQVEREKSSQGGLGIGLTLARQLVHKHGGRIEVASAGAGTGSTFTVYLPRLQEPVLPPEPRVAGSDPAGGRAHRVLVADDNADTAESLSMILTALGHTVRTARDGQEAVEAAAEFAPDVVLLDVGMPVLDGYEAARRIRALPGGDRIRLIALTGWGSTRDKREAAEAGFHHHMTKPVDPLVLSRMIAAGGPDR